VKSAWRQVAPKALLKQPGRLAATVFASFQSASFLRVDCSVIGLREQLRFDIFEPALELALVPRSATPVDSGGGQVTTRTARRQLVGDLFLVGNGSSRPARDLLGDLVQDRLGAPQSKPTREAGAAASRTGQGRKRRGDAVEHAARLVAVGALGCAFGRLDAFPIVVDRGLGRCRLASGWAAPKTCGWRRSILSTMVSATASKSKAPILAMRAWKRPGAAGRPVVLQAGHILTLDRVGHLIGLLDRVGRDRLEILTRSHGSRRLRRAGGPSPPAGGRSAGHLGMRDRQSSAHHSR